MDPKRLELKPKPKLILNVGGKDYEMTRPKIGAVMQLEEDMEAAKDEGGKGAARVVKEFVVKSGLPEEIVSELDTEDLLAISDFLVPSKKN